MAANSPSQEREELDQPLAPLGMQRIRIHHKKETFMVPKKVGLKLFNDYYC